MVLARPDCLCTFRPFEEIDFCPLHAAAWEMAEVLRELVLLRATEGREPVIAALAAARAVLGKL